MWLIVNMLDGIALILDYLIIHYAKGVKNLLLELVGLCQNLFV